ncbi:MAG: hypothetical protein Ct9H90mP18_08120 [Gammaproteobacteria bacterium]|nr:MAG: hypothetical protein Ct9H90mP18_08120 [Gammaproteobacteria bacterium]
MLSESDSDDLPVTDMKSELSNLLDVKKTQRGGISTVSY